MPLGNYNRYTFSFRDGECGWTESWIAAGVPSQSAAATLANAYLYVRMPLMGVNITADFVRISALDGSGVSYKLYPALTTTPGGGNVTTISGVVLPGSGGIAPIYSGNPDRPYSSLFFPFFNAQNQQKLIYLSGIPDDVITDPVGPTYVANYLNGIRAWRLFIINNQWGWLSRRGNAPQPKVPITAVVAGNPGQVTAPNATVAPNDNVQVGGFRGKTGYRGKGIVLSNVAGLVTIAGYSPAGNYTGTGGYLQKIVYTFTPAVLGQNPRETHRSRGKGSLVPVGRRKAKRN